ncbi:MAG: trigger factor [Rikenellaceae bacterium]|nr:trigger factor [Rikenellaceae bacterium]
MNIVRENLENLTSLLKVTVSESDYAEAVEKALRQYKKKANIPGFRPGMVPMGVINKMYRKGVTAEESYRAASKAAFDYFEKEKIQIIGDLLPSEQQKELDFDNDTAHEFVFEFAETPEVNLALSKKDKVTEYEIKVSDQMREGYRSNFMRRFGRLVDADKAEKDEALTVTLDNDEMKIEEAYVGLISMSDDERGPFIGKKVGDTMEVNVNELYKTPAQRASILQVKEDELAGINPNFKLTITKIRKFAEPEINDEFFKMAFPDGNVKDAEGFDKYIDEQVGKDLKRESDYLFTLDLRKFLIGKAGLVMPEAFLKQWLFTINEGKFSMEEIEKDFAAFLDMMRWNIIQKKVIADKGITLTPDEVMTEAKALAMMQFTYYGMSSVADDMLENYAKNILGNKEEAQKIQEKLFERKVVDALIPEITVQKKAVTSEEFGKLAEAANQR